MRWPKYWSFRFSIIPSKEIPGLISFRMDWLDLLAVQGTLESLLQHHSSKASILKHSAFFTVQLSHPYMTTGKTIALTRWTFVGKVSPPPQDPSPLRGTLGSSLRSPTEGEGNEGFPPPPNIFDITCPWCQETTFITCQLWFLFSLRLDISRLPLWLSWSRIHLQCRRPGFKPWVEKIPWRRK